MKSKPGKLSTQGTSSAEKASTAIPASAQVTPGKGIKLNGVVPVMMLPLDSDENLDEKTFRRQVDFAISSGAVAVCAPGFATEFYKLTDKEKYRVAELLVEQTADRVPVFISTSSGSTHATIEFSRFAEKIGAQGLMIAAPKWCALGVKELTAFYEAVCGSVSLAVMLQDADFTGGGLPPKLCVDLAERCPNFLFAKLENILPGAKCAEIIRLSGGKLQILYGLGGVAMIDGLEHGATGMMPGSALVDVYARVFQLWDLNRKDDAKALFYRLQPYLSFALQHLEIAIQIEKRVLVRRGIFPSDQLREPTLHLDDTYQKEMEGLVDRVMGLCQEVNTAAASV
jgi:4-hydroxy-tetrahydrodipicolinate synthase